MADKNQIKQANEVFKQLCATLNDLDWHYVADEDNLTVELDVQGDDLPIAFEMTVDPERQLIRFISRMPFKMKDIKVGAVAINLINYALADGSFDMSINSGNVAFRITSSYRDSLVSKDLLRYMVSITCSTVDDYNDKLFDLSRGVLSLEDFVKFVRED